MVQRMAWLIMPLVLLIASCGVDACGHHGHVLHQTHHFAQLHSNHKQTLKQNTQQVPLDTSTSKLDSAARSLLGLGVATASRDSQAPAPAPIRIHVEYQGLDALQISERSLVIAVTRTVMQVISSYLLVRSPVQGRFLLSPVCERFEGASCRRFYPAYKSATRVTDNSVCGESHINPSHVKDPYCSSADGSTCTSQDGKGTGEQTDLYIYVTAVENEQCGNSVAAWALSCMYDADTNRPVVGNVNLCPHALSITNPDDLVAVVMHETLHVLGFSDALFGLYIDPSTRDELGVSKVQANKTVEGQQVAMVITPTVVREARAQFGCSSLEGAQLEDEGDVGSANSHWEYTHYQGDLMVASTSFSLAGEPARISRLTLALLEDSGWYVGNWSAVGGPLQWGDNVGCTLPASGCQRFSSGISPSSSDKSTNMFCDVEPTPEPGARQSYLPSSSYRSVGLCSSNKFTNKCGIVQSRGGPSCLDSSFQYANPENFGWYSGPTSRPYAVQYKFEVSLADGSGSFLYYPATGNSGDTDAVCYPSICKGSSLYLTIFGREIRCPAGQYVDLSVQMPGVFKTGLVGPCPDEREVCRTLDCGDTECNVHGGTCYAGECQCKLGWMGPGCAFSLVRNSTAPRNPQGLDNPQPPSPTMQNFTNWRQQIQVRCSLVGMQPEAFTGVSSKFLRTFSEWAGISTGLFAIQSAALAPSGAPSTSTSITDPTASAVGAGTTPGQTGTQTGGVQGSAVVDTQGSSVQSSLGWLLRRALLGHSQQQATAAGLSSVPVLSQAWQGVTGFVQRALLGTQDQEQPLVVLTTINPSSSSQTSELMSQLADPLRQAQLTRHMSGSGFHLVQGSLVARLSIVEETVRLPVLTPGAQKEIQGSKDFTETQDDTGKAMSWEIILIAGCVGAAALVLTCLVLIITCACKAKGKPMPIAAGPGPVPPAPLNVACIQEVPQEGYVGINLHASEPGQPPSTQLGHGEVYVIAHSPPPEQRRPEPRR